MTLSNCLFSTMKTVFQSNLKRYIIVGQILTDIFKLLFFSSFVHRKTGQLCSLQYVEITWELQISFWGMEPILMTSLIPVRSVNFTGSHGASLHAIVLMNPVLLLWSYVHLRHEILWDGQDVAQTWSYCGHSKQNCNDQYP